MQGKKIILMAACITSLLVSVTSYAWGDMSAPYGWYAEGNGGWTRVSDKSYPGSTTMSGVAWNINAGYKFMPYLAGEVGYTSYASTQIKNGGTKAATDRHQSYDLAAKAILPVIDSGLEAFAKVGAARVMSRVSINNSAAAAGFISSSKNNATGLFVGLGLQYYFTPSLAGVAQWQRAIGNSNTGTLDLYSLGLSYIFYGW